MVDELEALLDGRRTLRLILAFLGHARGGKGLNLKALFDDPPAEIVDPQNLDDKYFSDGADVDIGVLFRVVQVFDNTTAVAYAAWFN
jgi:hypothetical protein